MSDLTISMAVNGNAILQLSTTESKNFSGKFAIIALLIQNAVAEKIDLSSIQLIDSTGKLVSITEPMEYEAAKEALHYIKREFERALHIEGRIVVKLNSPR